MDSQETQGFVSQEDDSDNLYEAIEITAERRGQYRIRWAGNDPKTGKPWAQTWASRKDCTDILISDWRQKQREKKLKQTGRSKSRSSHTSSTRDAAAVSASTPHTLRPRRSDVPSASPARQSITRPSTTRDSPSPQPRKRKRASSAHRKSSSANDIRHVPSAAVPPSKRQRTIASESETEEDEPSKPVMPIKKPKKRIIRMYPSDFEDFSGAEQGTSAAKAKARGSVKKYGRASSSKRATPRNSIVHPSQRSDTEEEVAEAPVKTGPPKGKKRMDSTSTTKSGSTAPINAPQTSTGTFGLSRPHAKATLEAMSKTSGLLRKSSLTQSQIAALRQEEESQTQDPGAFAENGEDYPAEKSPQLTYPSSQPGSSTHKANGANGKVRRRDEEERDPLFLPDVSDSDREGAPSPSQGSRSQVSRTGDAASSPSSRRAMLPPEPRAAVSKQATATNHASKHSLKPAGPRAESAAVQSAALKSRVNPGLVELMRKKTPSASGSGAKSMRPIPQISPSTFRPHLSEEQTDLTSSIEQFSSPEKGKARASSVRNWDSSARSEHPTNLRREQTLGPSSRQQPQKKPLLGVAPIRPSIFHSDVSRKGKEKASDKMSTKEQLDMAMRLFEQASQSQDRDTDQDQGQVHTHVQELEVVMGQFDEITQEEIQAVQEAEDIVEGDGRTVRPVDSQDVVPPSSSKHISDDSQTQSQGATQSLEVQLASALNVLNLKSEEIESLERMLAEQRKQVTDLKTQLQAERDTRPPEPPERAQESVHTQTNTSPTDESQKLALELTLAAERASWEAKRSEMQDRIASLEGATKSAISDRDFFMAQYTTASTFATEMRTENDQLVARATLAESQVKNGIALVRATYDTRVKKLESEVSKRDAMVKLLQERALKTDDNLRLHAAMAPELSRENELLRDEADVKRGQVKELKEDVAELERTNARLEKRLEKLERKLVWAEKNRQTEADSATSTTDMPQAKVPVPEPQPHSQQVPDEEENSDSDDEDFVPGRSESELSTSESSSEEEEPVAEPAASVTPLASSPAPVFQEAREVQRKRPVSPEEDVPLLPDVDAPEAESGEDMVFRCAWRPKDTNERCETLLGSKEVRRL
ncbi:hypothetical protein EVG20_g4056 [Dentipellis fragilis]|uniref:Chromo domain-containing protein n=1 Tax=Dentipellis fragilis TaxID=205917 RepID=A0A4Y9YXX6_9AGAM|nr:hypothetical protein EVG20_g4056 [Dentipellis fragilis]